MSKFTLAASYIKDTYDDDLNAQYEDRVQLSEEAARRLGDAGLLAPDLPEPSRGVFPRGAVWNLTGQIGDIRHTGEGIVVFGSDCQFRPFRLMLTEAEAEAIAHALLAAADYAEGKQ